MFESPLKLPPVMVGWSDREKGWLSQRDYNRLAKMRRAIIIGRAKSKLTVLEYNHLALYIRDIVLADQANSDPT